jgi:hypothetical protein
MAKYKVLAGTAAHPAGDKDHPIVADGRQFMAGDVFDEKELAAGTIASLLYVKLVEKIDEPAPPPKPQQQPQQQPKK